MTVYRNSRHISINDSIEYTMFHYKRLKGEDDENFTGKL